MRDPGDGFRLNNELGGLMEIRSGRIPAPGDSYMDEIEKAGRAAKAKASAQMRLSNLDTPEALTLHQKLMGWYVHELDRQSENRVEMAMDEDFYDHIQWTDEEVAVLQARGQAPLVFNVTQTTINWVLGTQRRMPRDFRVLPRRKEGGKSAQRKSELLKHVGDENRSDFEWSEAFQMAVRAGLGWMECGQGRPEEGIKVYDRHEDWRSMLWDSTSRRYDLLDARYLFRTKWLDEDIAAALWSKRKGVIGRSAASTLLGFYDTDEMGDQAMDSQEAAYFRDAMGTARTAQFGISRQRVRVIECWFKLVDQKAMVIKGGQFSGELFDEWSPGHWSEISNGFATVTARPMEVIHVALMTDSGLLDLRPSPYRHNRYPFTPVWGYRRRRDGMPYGMIRGIRDIQRDLNKRASKALHHLSSTRVVINENSIPSDGIDAVRDEAARPDAVLVWKGIAPPDIQTDTNLAAAHVEMMSRDGEMIQQIGGVTDENLGRRTNASSGIAIQRRQDQGALSTSMFFENMRLSRSIHGEKQMVLVETYYDEKDEFRITDSRGNPDFRPINDGDPANAIAEFKADFIISEDDWRASARQAQAEALLELAKQLAQTAPQLVVGMLDLIVEALDVPKRDELVKRIRSVTGQSDPDADPDNPDPETLAQQQAQAEQSAMAKRAAEAELGAKEADARKKLAEAMKIERGATTDVIEQLRAAMEVAVQIAGASVVAEAADRVLAEARNEAAGQVMPAPAPQPTPAM